MPTSPFLDPDTIHTPSVGGTPPASWGAAIRENQLGFARPPGCSVQSASSPGTSLGTSWTSIKFDGADARDTDGYHDPGSNPERITIPAGLGGWYAVTGVLTIAANSTGSRMLRLVINGSGTRPLSYVSASGVTVAMVIPFAEEILLNAGDYIELQAQMSVAGPLASTARMSCRLVAWP